MSKARFFIAISAIVSAAACAEAPTQDHRAAMRFDTAPIEFSRNPKMMTQLNQTFTTNEDDLLDVAERIEIETKNTQEARPLLDEIAQEEPAEPTPLPESTLIY